MRELFVPWAKLGGGTYPADAHPVLCHLLDVATCARAIWDDVLSPVTRRRWAAALGQEPDTAGRWIAFWAGSHDIGKVSPTFQIRGERYPEVRRALEAVGLTSFSTGEVPHATISDKVLRMEFCRPSGWPAIERRLAAEVAAVIGGHHGIIPSDEDRMRISPRSVGQDRWEELRAAMLARLAEAVAVTDIPAPLLPTAGDRGFFLFLAGLIAVADWLGSNKDHFRPAGCDEDWGEARWQEYRGQASVRAAKVLKDLGWTGWNPHAIDPLPFNRLFQHIATPRPLQVLTAEIADATPGPGLILIESPMGEGKTEAALYVADRQTHAGRGQGFYVALPTMATSNQMFGRVAKFLSHRYPEDVVNVQLLHGQTELNETFRRLREKGKGLIHELHDGQSGAVVAEEWFAKDKKQGLLAPFAVGTIDQALLAVLQVRFGFVRLFGLAGKTVILDEVHAYDAYMSVLLGRLLRWLSSLGCPVVLLSATLPEAKRRELVAAYLGVDAKDLTLPRARYPRVTTADTATGSVDALPIPPSPDAKPKTIRVLRVRRAELAERLGVALASGGNAAVICNTVGRAQEVYCRLKTALQATEVKLFHARFPLGDRAEIEKGVLGAYGPPGTGRRPYRSVLVATQVVEQSLDLDFDLLVTEYAPIDLLLQRSGRLHRHARPRPPGFEEPELWLLDPDGETAGVPDFGAFEVRGDGGVYHRYVLLRTYLALSGRNDISLPGDIEPLVEAVYGEEKISGSDEGWRAALEESRQTIRLAVEDSEANAFGGLIPKPDASNLLRQCSRRLDEDDPQAHASRKAQTREIGPTVSLVLLHAGPAGPSTTADGSRPIGVDRISGNVVARLIPRSVSLGRAKWVRHFAAERHRPAAWAECGPLRFHRLAVLDAEGRYRCEVGTLRLDPELGVVYE